MESTNKIRLNGLAQKLAENNLLDEASILSALDNARNNNISFISYLIKNKLLNSKKIALVLASYIGMPYLDVASIDKTNLPLELINVDLIRKHQILPLYKNEDHLYVALADPTHQLALDEIKFHTGLQVHGFITEQDKLTKLIDEIYSLRTLQQLVTDNNPQPTDVEKKQETESDAPIVRFVYDVLQDTIKKNASDIHFEPYESGFRIRMRIDGLLHEIAHAPKSLSNQIITRIKIMSNIDISERRLPQDGRFELAAPTKQMIDFRVSTCPTIFGEKVVIRILDPRTSVLAIDSLGFEPDQKDIFLKAIRKPHGMILVTGTTGSGKTVTLHAALQVLNKIQVNIVSIEDPAEIRINGINQVNVNVKSGLTFAAILRSLLRQDPDIIMVGEMRDLETAEIAIKAAQTGHLVLSTLHTNNAVETLTRLSQLGLPLYNIATSLTLIVAQRLIRRLCNHCKQKLFLPDEILKSEGLISDEIEKLILFQAKGCEQCMQGYKGRVGIFEMLPITETISEFILKNKNPLEIMQAARSQGMQTLREIGLKKIRQGITTLEEVNRVSIE